MPEVKTSDQLAVDRTDLAVTRSVMAADRSLLASVRTSLSMIGFGFTIFKFLHQVGAKESQMTLRDTGPRDIGLFLCGLGTVTLILEIVVYWKAVKAITGESGYSPWRTALFNAACITAMGLWLFGLIFVNAVLR